MLRGQEGGDFVDSLCPWGGHGEPAPHQCTKGWMVSGQETVFC